MAARRALDHAAYCQHVDRHALRMIRLHTSIDDLEGTAYFELLPGPYRNECWSPKTVFLDEEAFGFIEPIFIKICPKYDHYAFTEIGRPLWRGILTELDALAAFLEDTPTDKALSARFGFYFRDTERIFFENRSTSVNKLRQVIRDLTSWFRVQLDEYSIISVLGLVDVAAGASVPSGP